MIFPFIPKNQEDKQGDPTKVYRQYSAWRGDLARIQLGHPGLAPVGKAALCAIMPSWHDCRTLSSGLENENPRETLIHRPQTISS